MIEYKGYKIDDSPREVNSREDILSFPKEDFKGSQIIDYLNRDDIYSISEYWDCNEGCYKLELSRKVKRLETPEEVKQRVDLKKSVIDYRISKQFFDKSFIETNLESIINILSSLGYNITKK